MDTGVVESYRDAFLTPFEVAPWVHPESGVSTGPPWIMRGAAYANGRLVRSSLRQYTSGLWSEDPVLLPANTRFPEHLRGTWLYGGHWFNHFGHFLLETLSALWPEPSESLDGLIFHLPPEWERDENPNAWQATLLHRAGWHHPIRFVTHQGVTVDQLHVPTRGFRLAEGGIPDLVGLWNRIAPFRAAEGPVFLSRTRLTVGSRVGEGDDTLERILASHGIPVVHPQELPMAEQIDVVSRASCIIGMAGSQLHASIFARSCRQVIEIGDSRFPDLALPDQVSLTILRGQRHTFIPRLMIDGHRDAARTASLILEALDA